MLVGGKNKIYVYDDSCNYLIYKMFGRSMVLIFFNVWFFVFIIFCFMNRVVLK